MICAVIIFARTTCDNAAHTPVVCTRCFHRVFMVVAARLFWQDVLVIAEHLPVSRIVKRPALLDCMQRFTCFNGQVRKRDLTFMCRSLTLPRRIVRMLRITLFRLSALQG